jgi:hypothetical protein
MLPESGSTGSVAAGSPAGPRAAPAAEIAAQTTKLITLSYGARLPAADLAELERTVQAQVAAGLVLRRYPLANGDEPMLVTGPDPGGPR